MFLNDLERTLRYHYINKKRRQYKEYKEKVQSDYNQTLKEFNKSRNAMESALQKLGEMKANAWNMDVQGFLNIFGYICNYQIDSTDDLAGSFRGIDVAPEMFYNQMMEATQEHRSILQNGIDVLGTGALIGLAAYDTKRYMKDTVKNAVRGGLTRQDFVDSLKNSTQVAGAGIIAGLLLVPIIGLAAPSIERKRVQREAEKKTLERMELSTSDMKQVIPQIRDITKLAKSYTRIVKQLNLLLGPFIDEIRIIISRYQNNVEKIDFTQLALVEQSTIHVAWRIARVYYYILQTPIVNELGIASGMAEMMLKDSQNEINQLKKDTSQMIYEDRFIGDIVWREDANKWRTIGFIVSAFFLIYGVFFVSTEYLVEGLCLFACSFIAFPIFFYFRNMAQSSLCMFRKARVIIAVVLALIPFVSYVQCF